MAKEDSRIFINTDADKGNGIIYIGHDYGITYCFVNIPGTVNYDWKNSSQGHGTEWLEWAIPLAKEGLIVW